MKYLMIIALLIVACNQSPTSSTTNDGKAFVEYCEWSIGYAGLQCPDKHYRCVLQPGDAIICSDDVIGPVIIRCSHNNIEGCVE